MSIEKKLESLENRLMENGYTSLIDDSGTCLLMKGKIGVHLYRVPALREEDYNDKCAMEIRIPSISNDVSKYWLLFGISESGGKRVLFRNFPYTKVPTCLGGHLHYHQYILDVSDEDNAIETIEREVEFTRKMLVNAKVFN